jgi:hypothetical protein
MRRTVAWAHVLTLWNSVVAGILAQLGQVRLKRRAVPPDDIRLANPLLIREVTPADSFARYFCSEDALRLGARLSFAKVNVSHNASNSFAQAFA